MLNSILMHLNPPKPSILPKYHRYLKIQLLTCRKHIGLLAETDRLCWLGNNCCYSENQTKRVTVFCGQEQNLMLQRVVSLVATAL
jgi:hypothetical protein